MKSRKNMTYNKDKNKLIQTDPELTKMLQLEDENNKTVLMTVVNFCKKLEEILGRYKKGSNQSSAEENYNG